MIVMRDGEVWLRTPGFQSSCQNADCVRLPFAAGTLHARPVETPCFAEPVIEDDELS